jgi:hypothetical protein
MGMTGLFHTALMITGFVLAMMLLIEYLNVLSAGRWQEKLAARLWGQYALGVLLGAVPGCLGAFTVVAMYSHGVLTLGAVVATMIATSGDEAFVMLALFPERALMLTAILAVFGLAVGVLVDIASGRRRTLVSNVCLQLHQSDRCERFPRGRMLEQWRNCSPARGTLATSLGIFLTAVLAGRLGRGEPGWVRASLSTVSILALFIVATVPDHFLEEHLWRHVAVKHAPRVFLWTFGALIAMYLLTSVLHLGPAIRGGKWIMLLAACLVGLIPESGPHLIFVTLFSQGVVPFGVLLASSAVQDGHGMLPMLAHSTRDFMVIKAITFAAGLSLGAVALALGW